MANDMEQLLFAKQLMDNTEFANEAGLCNLLKIIETGSNQVVNGTRYAPGAFAAWKRLVSKRPDLFSDALIRDLEERTRDGNAYYLNQAVEYVRKFLER